VHILVEVANDRLCREIVDVLVRAGHTIERGAPTRAKQFELALVGSAEVAERLRRERPTAAIIVVTKVGDVPARVRALEVGADDAFDASFPHSQIAARVGAVGRRAAMTPPAAERIELDGCTIDLSASIATRGGETVQLTAREVEIVRWLAGHAGHVVSRADLLQHVWRVSPGNSTRAVDVAIVGLRAKLERDPAEPAIIVSIRGTGYRWGT
jgi:two-component system, OmpR family, response regulator